MQGASVQTESSLQNKLRFGSAVYDNIDTAETYLPTSQFTIDKTNRATLVTTIYTNSKYITPVIDLDNMSLVCVEHMLNAVSSDDITEILNDGGVARSRYITREVELNDPADQINIYLDVNRPNERSNIFVYVKLKYDSKNYSNWIKLNPVVGIPITSNKDSFSEVAYVHDSSANDFVSFTVKIVFSSESSVDVTTVKNLRAIATT
jgi:hypothetical protein